MSHAFLINCHKDAAEVCRLASVLARYSPDSSIDVYYDGEGGEAGDRARREILRSCGTTSSVIQAPYQPDKCWSILRAVSRLVETSKADTATFLHSDIVPTDWTQFRRFIERFEASGKWITWCPMLPGHVGMNFCNLNFNVKLAAKYFPIKVPSANMDEWFNEIQFTRHLDRVNLLWREDSYKMGGIVQPFTGCIRNNAGEKLAKSWHSPDYEFWVHDFFPESSVIHCDSPEFWERYHEICRP